MDKLAKANITGFRQETQYSCMAACLTAAFQAHGKEVTETDVNRVLGAVPMGGSSWEMALGTAQYFGMRGTLLVPCTVEKLKEWTDAGIPVLIAWNPEGRNWSHVSVVSDVEDDHTVHIMDPNMPDPSETFRVLPRKEFYSKWYEDWDKFLLRRPALAIERDISVTGIPRTASTVVNLISRISDRVLGGGASDNSDKT